MQNDDLYKSCWLQCTIWKSDIGEERFGEVISYTSRKLTWHTSQSSAYRGGGTYTDTHSYFTSRETMVLTISSLLPPSYTPQNTLSYKPSSTTTTLWLVPYKNCCSKKKENYFIQNPVHTQYHASARTYVPAKSIIPFEFTNCTTKLHSSSTNSWSNSCSVYQGPPSIRLRNNQNNGEEMMKTLKRNE